MAKRPQFALSFSTEAIGHLDWIDPKHHELIHRTIKEQLTYTPEVKTRNRKPLTPPAPFQATWELRCGPDNRFRVLYNIDTESLTVQILAIGVKDGNRLVFGEAEEE